MRNFVKEFREYHNLDCSDVIFYFLEDKLHIALTVNDLLLKEEYAYILNDMMRGGKFISVKKEEVEDFLQKIYK